MSRHPTAQAGKKLGRYRIENELGRGGMGVVYVATDENTGRQVALKTTSVAGLGSAEKARNQRRERFIREVRALTQVNHDNVVHVFDAGEVDDADLGWLLYYTMDYVEGTTLAALGQERGPLGPGEAAAVVVQVAAGLGEAHRQGIIHRDVKPANIFLSHDGRALIGDFGIAKIEGSTQITRRDQLVGTPNYLAPEQILGEAIGPPTDVFALGALFYVITQNRPLRPQIAAAALLASANGNEPQQRVLGTALPDALKRTVARCLDRDPAKRFADGTAFADALADFATRVPALKPAPAPSFLAEGTADRSNAFASSPDAPAAADPAGTESFGNDADGIEAMARAMLGEVERRATGTYKAPPRAPLPVARSEPTAMFNLRAMEAARAAPPPSSSPSSSLAVHGAPENPFGGLGGVAAPAPRPPSGPVKRHDLALERVTDDGAPMPAPTAMATAPTPAPTPAPRSSSPSSPSAPSSSPSSAVSEFAMPETTAPLPDRAVAAIAAVVSIPPLPPRPARPARPPRPPPPRHVLVAASLAAGLLCGAAVAVVGRPASRQEQFAVVRPRPALCPERRVTPDEAARAQALLEEARAQKAAGAPRSRVLEKLRAGVALDPTNALLFYELGQATLDREQDDAYECVCRLAPDSRECGALEKARAP